MRARLMSLWEGWASRADAVPRPSDAPRATASGYDMDRVLILGTGPATGWGVTTHDLALPGALARALSARTGRGAMVEVIERPRLRADEVLSMVDRVDLSRFDAVVLLLGVSDAAVMASPTWFRGAMTDVVDALLAQVAVGTGLIVGGIPPIRSIPVYDSLVGEIAETHARLLEQQLVGLCAANDSTVFVSLPLEMPAGASERPPAAAAFTKWAALLADAVAPALEGPHHLDGERRIRPAATAHGGAYGDAAAELARVHGASDDRIRSIVDLAKRAFQADTAFLALVDDDGSWTVVRSRTDLEAMPDMTAFCAATIADNRALVLRNVPDDPRFRAERAVTDPPVVRFFAGHPIESQEGARTGVLAVHDSVPRRRDSDVLDEVFLQELAMLAQQSLWKYLA